MPILIIILHVFACVALIMIVLLQTGKGADMGAAFGGGGSQTLFGSTGASTFLSKATTVAAIVFMLTCFTLAYTSTHQKSRSIIEETAQKVEQTAPEATSQPEATTQNDAAPAAPAATESAPEEK